jgi:hypothetical protein
MFISNDVWLLQFSLTEQTDVSMKAFWCCALMTHSTTRSRRVVGDPEITTQYIAEE